MRHRHPRLEAPARSTWDAVVVGAGPGGLVAASLLAGQGLAVLLVERHHVPGGNLTSFRRHRHRFEVGLHAVGDNAPGGALQAVLAAAGVRDVPFSPLDPGGTDILRFPGLDLPVPASIPGFRTRLLSAFPGEEDGVDRFVQLVRDADAYAPGGAADRDPPAGGAPSTRGARVRAAAGATLSEVLERFTPDPRLRAVLAGLHLLHALPPSRVSAFAHASVVAHQLRGAGRPSAGGGDLAERLARGAEARGARLWLRAEVTGVHAEAGGAWRVEIAGARGTRHEHRAGNVVLAGDLPSALHGLLGPSDLDPGSGLARRTFEMAPGLGILSLGLRRDLRELGVKDAQVHFHRVYDVEPAYRAASGGRLVDPDFAFVSLGPPDSGLGPGLRPGPGARAGPSGARTAQVLTVVPSAPESWGIRAGELADGTYSRDPAYRAAKARLGEALLAIGLDAMPALAGQVVYREIGTPLTHHRFTASTGGTGYGLAATPSQTLTGRPGPRTPARGLYLCGASTRAGHGVLGAMVSGLRAAEAVLDRGLQVL